MPFAAALSTKSDTAQALAEICSSISSQLPGPPDLTLVFFSPQHDSEVMPLICGIRDRLAPRCLLGCNGESIVGNDREVEQGPALSVWTACWNVPVSLTPFHLVLEKTPEGPSLMGWPDELERVNPDQAMILLLGDPYSFTADEFLKQINERHPGLRVMGGMASGGLGPGQSQLALDGLVAQQGAVGILIQGSIKVRSVVSQGCRPIGRHLVITKGRDNIIQELGGKPALLQLQEIWQGLAPADQKLLQQGLHIGRVINEYQSEFQRGDFLVRNVQGIDRTEGAVAITDRIRVGQTVQFHVRDAGTADEDLNDLLQMDIAAHEHPPRGTLLFTCNGRGTRLFDLPNHDAKVVRFHTREAPLAGFFAAGELGPIGGQNFIHGFTASVVLFED